MILFPFCKQRESAVHFLYLDCLFQGKEAEARVTIFRKTEESYCLKLKASREFYSKVSSQGNYLVTALKLNIKQG